MKKHWINSLRLHRFWILLWIAGILFPMASLGRISPGFRLAFNEIFGQDWTHIVMHAFLFTVLALLACGLAGWLSRSKSLLLALGSALIIGLFQEGLQALASGSFSFAGMVFDLGVDLSGGAIGWVIWQLLYGLFWTKSRAY